jgi:hypothetical protein
MPVLAQEAMFRNDVTAGAVSGSDLIGPRIYVSEVVVDADEHISVQD